MTIQERVWLNRQPNGTEELFFVQQDDGDTPYVPEQRARDAKREAAERFVTVNAYARKADALIEENRALRTERDALRADLLALVPLARVGDAILTHMDRVPDGEPLEMSRELFEALRLDMTSAARAILARVATEGTS